MISKRYISLLLLLLILTVLSCDDNISIHMRNPNLGTYVKLYTQSPCDTDSIFLGETSNIYLMVFDKQNALVTYLTRDHVNLTNNKEFLIPLEAGEYSIIGWIGISELLNTHVLTPGKTLKKDLMCTIKSHKDISEHLKDLVIMQGISQNITIPKAKTDKSTYIRTAVNLQEKTNRVNVEIEFDKSILNNLDFEDFEVSIKSSNTNINIDGSQPDNSPILTFPSIREKTDTGFITQFTLLDLNHKGNGYLTITNKKNGSIIYEGDLLGSIILKNPTINFDCDHDFNIKYHLKDKCIDCDSYICWSIFVNDWLIHSYEVEPGGNH